MISSVKPNFNPDNFSLTAVGGKNFFSYLKSFNLLNEPDVLMLSPNSHFYYDKDDLLTVRTFIILKKLNLIDDLDTFLNTVFHILPANVNFVGCFSESKTFLENGFLSELSARFNNLLDLRTIHYLNKKDVSELLKKHGFKIIDMTDMNELTFFYSQTGL
jgi:hypothetical protein